MKVIADKKIIAFGLGCFALGSLTSFRETKNYLTDRVQNKPDIGISFDNPEYAEQLRQSGDLDILSLYDGAKSAVENYYYLGLKEAAGKVIIILPRREDLKQSRKLPAEKSSGCEPD